MINHNTDTLLPIHSVRSSSPVANGHEREREKTAELYCPTEVRILVVDDDEQICRLIQATLASETFLVDAASLPSEIETRIKEHSEIFHLVILDYVIPGLESEEVLEWLREHQPEASVIVVTAYPSVDSAVSCLRTQQTFDYLPKPFQPAHLKKVVTRCLEGKGLLRLSEAALRETLGTAIRERRKKLGLTLQQMAHRTGVSLGYLSQIELGKNSASIETLYRICLGLGIKLSELFHIIQPH